MANKNLFKSKKSVVAPVAKAATAVNEAGGKAYALSDKAALAQFAMTGTFNGTFYASAENQLQKTLDMAAKVPTEFLAKLAVYARQNGLMKDMPAVLAAVVAGRDSDTLSKIFNKVIDNPKMLRNFVQVIRSGAVGRKSLGTRPKKLIQNYLESLTDDQLFRSDIGNDPSMKDIVKLVHPKPSSKTRSALYGYILDKEYNAKQLPKLVREFESFKKDMSGDIPNVPFQMLTALPLKPQHWKKIAENATWNQTRMNLNTFARHGVFDSAELTKLVASKLQDEDQVTRAKVFPYQLFTTYQNVDSTVPSKVSLALQKAADLALSNVPDIDGQVYVMVDTSGSMSSPITGRRGSVSTKTTCVDVAALIASAILRKNPETKVIPFDTKVHSAKLNPLDSVVTNATILSKFGGGGTDCASALAHVNRNKGKGDLVIYVSDNESFMDDQHYKQTATMKEWDEFKKRNPQAKLVNIDIQPYATSQTQERADILNIGGFSDSVFEVISKFLEFGNNKDLWIKTIESVSL